MPRLDWHVTTAEGVTFVQVAVESDTERAVRIENCLSGPVWPPRAEGLPAPGWDEDGYEGTVPADRPLVLGYASPAEPTEPPVELVDRGPPEDGEDAPTPRAVVHALGEAGPPRAAVPQIRVGADGAGVPENGAAAATRAGDGSSPQRGSDGPDTASPPSALDTWLAALDRRADRAERLADVSSVAAAREAIAQTGGMAAVRQLETQLETDRAALERVRSRLASVDARLDDVAVPTETLERLR